MKGITVTLATRQLSAVSSFVVSVERFCDLIEHTSELPVHEFLKRISASMSQLYALALDLPDVYLRSNSGLPPSESGLFEAALTAYLGPYNFYNISLAPRDIQNPELAVGSLADDLGELYSDLHRELVYYRSDDLGKLEHAIWSWKFGLHAHWGEHLTNALRYIHYLLYTERIEYAKE
ncbi:MAG: DUF5063 domain-containing protein [Leptospirales bacterium]|nr:DUF5063 domain-containing protein [Leptospirales bacterium]